MVDDPDAGGSGGFGPLQFVADHDEPAPSKGGRSDCRGTWVRLRFSHSRFEEIEWLAGRQFDEGGAWQSALVGFQVVVDDDPFKTGTEGFPKGVVNRVHLPGVLGGLILEYQTGQELV